MKKRSLMALIASCLLIFSLLLTSCNGKTPDESGSDEPAADESSSETSNNSAIVNDMFTERDSRTDYNKSTAVRVALNRDSIDASTKEVVVNGTKATITDEGVYVLSGVLNDGMIIVNAEKTDKVHIVLNGVAINSSDCAPIYVASADKVFITLTDNSENTLTNGGNFVPMDANNIDGVIYSAEDISLNGNGKLIINSPAGNGIVTKDDLVVANGNYNITAAKRGLEANDSVRIKEASITISAGKDAIRAENVDDTSKGFVYVQSGKIDLVSKGDGITSSSYTQVIDGEIKVTTASSDNLASLKGIKAGENLIIDGGKFDLNTGDHALKSNKEIQIKNGEFTIKTTSDAMNADEKVSITGGTVNVTECREGIDCADIVIMKGTINIFAENDALASSVKDATAEVQTGEITIRGGTVNLKTKSGDGIDVKGAFNMIGGVVTVYGAKLGNSQMIACDGTTTLAGGVLAAYGWNAPVLSFSNISKAYISQEVTEVAIGEELTLMGGGTKPIVFNNAEASVGYVFISSPTLIKGNSYTLGAGSGTYEVVAQ